jgi:hypothetical protein
MRRSPSIVPDVTDRDVYLVLDDFDSLGRSWRETDEQSTDRTALVQDLLEGQYRNPVRVIAFNTAEGWSRDVSEEIADALLQRLVSEKMCRPRFRTSSIATARRRNSCPPASRGGLTGFAITA